MSSQLDNHQNQDIMEQYSQNYLKAQQSTQSKSVGQQKDTNAQSKLNYSKSQHYLFGTNILQVLFFTWISHLLKYGSKQPLDYQSIPELRDPDKSINDYQRLNSIFRQNVRDHRSNSLGVTLMKSILKSLKSQLIAIIVCSFISNGLLMYSPILSHNIIQYVSSGNKNIQTSFIYFGSIFLMSFTIMILRIFVWFKSNTMGYITTNALSLMIFKKSLKYPLITQKQFATGDIINYCQVDAQSMELLGNRLTVILCTPLQIIISFYLIYIYIGISFLVGLGVMLTMIFLTLIFFKMVAEGTQKMYKAKDDRIKITQEMLQIIKFIKVNVLEKYFFKKLTDSREKQLKIKMRVNISFTGTIFTYFLCSPMIIASTLLVYIALGNEITASKAFFTILIFKILQFPMYQLPQAISELIKVWTSVKRIQKFMFATEIKSQLIQIMSNEQKLSIQIEDGNFYWGKQTIQQKINQNRQDILRNRQNNEKSNSQTVVVSQQRLQQSLLSQKQKQQQNISSTQAIRKYMKALENINVQIPKNRITMIIGDIGSGKSSILYSILNQMTYLPKQKSKIKIYGQLAYCPQKPWIMSGTVQQNILFFSPFDNKRLNQVIEYSCLQEDLRILHKGIKTQIGQKGVNLSGGQKARISFARALYANKDIYLLDDILSAVDVHVGKSLMEKAIAQYLKGKTIIMPTHAIKYLNKADNIIILKKGKIIAYGDYDQISKSYEYVQILKAEQSKRKQQKENAKQQQLNKQIRNQLLMSKETHEKYDSNLEKQETKYTDKVADSLFVSQDQQIGKVSNRVYKQFISLNGGMVYVLSIFISMASWTFLSALSNIQIQKWCQNEEKQNKFIWLFLIFAISGAVFSSCSGFIFSIAQVRQGRIIHKKIIKSLLYTSITKFYNRVPVGRILNRLSKDLREMDQKLNPMVAYTVITLFSLVGCLSILVYTSSLFVMIPIVLVLGVFVKLLIYYLNSQRQCVRLQNISNSPIVSGLTSAINGIATVRAYKLSQQFFNNQISKIDLNKRVKVTYQALRQWFCVRLGIMSLVINAAVYGFAIFNDSQNGAMIGLLLTYSSSLIDDMTSFAQCLSDLEIKMISVQRLTAFTKLQPENGYLQYLRDWVSDQQGAHQNCIQNGYIQFRNYSTRYRQGLPLALKNISISIQKGKKIGIVGRTGAGKSTLINCLLRILEASEGDLLIDNKRIVDYNIKDLRAAITIIEQDPTLINASFRQNIDPGQMYDDQNIQKIIQDCNISEMIERIGGINSIVTNDNLSAGQKQLLCICRAFLKQSKIVLIDEATANIDVKNDQIIQNLVSKAFKNSTVLIIAHRLSTLRDCDQILVLHQGEIIQWGNVDELLKKEGGIYKKMWEQNDISYLS